MRLYYPTLWFLRVAILCWKWDFCEYLWEFNCSFFVIWIYLKFVNCIIGYFLLQFSCKTVFVWFVLQWIWIPEQWSWHLTYICWSQNCWGNFHFGQNIVTVYIYSYMDQCTYKQFHFKAKIVKFDLTCA